MKLQEPGVGDFNIKLTKGGPLKYVCVDLNLMNNISILIGCWPLT